MKPRLPRESEAFEAHMRSFVDTANGAKWDSDVNLRRAVVARAARLSGGGSEPSDQLPEALADYVDTVALHAYKVSDNQVAILKTAGFSEDAIFEITVSASLGAGMGRLERGLAALRGGT